MKKTAIAAIALGGAALFAIPAGVAYAVSEATDGITGIHSRMEDDDARGNSRSQGNDARGNAMGSGMGMGRGMGNFDHDDRGNIGGNMMGIDAADLVEEGATASSDDAASLTFMIEEEKLAHDLYVELGDAWDLRVFTNIASAEDQHAAQVRSLLDTYGLDDPTDGMAAGEFVDPALQDLYDTLLDMGLASRVDALNAAGLVEETDIMDLRSRASDSAAIDQVFSQLESGSENHLNAFVKNLDRLGVDYDAQVLDDADVAEILGQ